MTRFLPNGLIPSREKERVWRWQAWHADGSRMDPSGFPSARALQGEQVVPGIEMLYTDDDHRQIWTRVSSVPMRNEAGQIIGAVSAIVDMTEQKKAEQAIREFNTSLEEEVEERTQQLKETISQLESFNFIASHDLQEPLRKIRTYVELLKGFDLHNAALKQYVDSINDSTQRMSQLIESLLNYSRHTRATDAFRLTDLDEVFNNVKADYGIAIAEKQAVITSDTLPVIHAIPFQMHQLFANLLVNSLKFSDSHPVIRVTQRLVNGADVPGIPQYARNQQFIEIVFSDQGIGFDNRYSEKIFQLFQRLHPQLPYAGTGIGLSIVHRIVQQHNGYIKAESEPGKGAAFTIYLPVR